MKFEFATAARIIFGRGKISELPSLIGECGGRAMLVTGPTLKAPAIDAQPYIVRGEPTIESVREGASVARAHQATVIIGLGGGSAIDAAKAIAALATNPGDVLDYLEVVGRGQSITVPPLPVIAIPTTAGTGSEVTRNAVIGSPEHGVKASLRSALMLPKIALIDPLLTIGLPPAVTASTGLDALTQLIEPYVSSRANPVADLFCLEGIRRASTALRRAYNNGGDEDAREQMSFAALLGGLALANAGLGVVHGFAAPIGGMFPHAPHGAVCAAILPQGIAANIRALRERAPGHTALARYAETARILTGDPQAQPEDAVVWLQSLCADLRIPALQAWGIRDNDAPAIVEKAEQASSMKANPLPLTRSELVRLIQAVLDPS